MYMNRAIFVPLLLSAASALPAQADFTCAGDLFIAPAGAAAKATGNNGEPVSKQGRVEVLVIYAAFAGESAPPPSGSALHLLDADRPGSLSHFYRVMSFGELTVSGRVLPKRYRSREAASAYVAAFAGEWGDFGRFVGEVLTQVDRDVDLRLYDNDGPDERPDSGDDDGFVDFVFVNMRTVPRGFLIGGATGAAVLGHDYVSEDIGQDGTPIRIRGARRRGAIQEEGDFHFSAAVMAHEFGHGLGLQDLYDVEYQDPSEDSAGIGRWGLMGWGALGWNDDDGPNPMSARSLEQLGWVSVDNGRLVEITQDVKDLPIAPVRDGGTVVRVPLGGTDQEYLLLEHRTRASGYYDRSLPGEGLLVWRVRQRASNNALEQKKMVDLVCADGLYLDAGFPLGQSPDGRSGGDNLDFWAHDAAYRQSHGGNWGDATDPFDGLSVTRLHMDGNPSTLPLGPLSSALTGLEMNIRRQNEMMSVDLTLPTWSGSIGDEVVWTGQVWIDGDLRVAPEGRLSIVDGTRIRLAGSDRLRQGLDPQLVEILVNGNLELIAKGSTEPVVFEPTQAGRSWYGILLEPAAESLIAIRERDLSLTGALRGIGFPQAPAGLEGQTVINPRLIDASGPRTAGNGDGHLSPGETFQIALDVANWTMETYDDMRGELRWLTSSIASAGDRNLVARLDISAIHPAMERSIAWPSLTLSPDAQPGEMIEFSIFVGGLGTDVRRETLSFVVSGDYPSHSAVLEVQDRSAHDGLTVIPYGMTSTIEATIEGNAAAAELVVHPTDAALPVLQLPMTRYADSVFQVDFEPPAPGEYELLLRVHGTEGSVVFSDARIAVWALPGARTGNELPVLAIVGDGYSSGRAKRIATALQEQVEALGTNLHLIHFDWLHPEKPDRLLSSGLLSYYGQSGGLVIWIGDFGFSPEALQGLSDFLEKGGRLLLATNVDRATPRERDFLESMLYTGIGSRRGGGGTIQSLYPLENITFEVSHSLLEPVPPSVPIFVDRQNRSAGLSLDTGVYRALFLPFGMEYVKDEVLERLFGSSLLFLEQHAVREASLEFDGAMAHQSALVAPGAPVRLVARIAGDISRAEVMLSRGAPNFGEPIGVLHLTSSGGNGELQEFDGIFRPPDAGRYRLSLRAYDSDDEIVVTSAQLNILVHDTEPDLLVLWDHTLPTAPTLSDGVSALEVDPGDWQVMDLLLERYLDAGDVVAVMASDIHARVLDALREFVADGGHLLVTSDDLRETLVGEAFLRDVVGVEKAAGVKAGPFDTRGLAPGPNVSTDIRFVSFERLRAPALPLARTAAGEIAAVRRVTATGHVVYLPFGPARMNGGDGERLAQLALSALRVDLPADASFAIPDHEIDGYSVMLPADRATSIQAWARGGVNGIDLLVQDYDDVKSLNRMPMRRGADGHFEADFQPPAVGHYLLFLELRTRHGTFLASTSLRGDALTFGTFHPVLLLLGEHWPPPALREEVTADVVEALRRRGLEANVVVAAEDAPLFDAMVDNYLGPGEMVIWMGRLLMGNAQNALTRYLMEGGRLLMASADFRYSPGGPEFLQEWLGVEQVSMGFPAKGRRFFSVEDPVRPIDEVFDYAELTPNAEVALWEEDGGVAGVRVAGAYRSVYLSFNMHKLGSTPRLRILDEAIDFLSSGVPQSPAAAMNAGQADLRIIPSELPKGPVSLTHLAPRIAVRNQGNGDADPFRVGYQILRGDSIVAVVHQVEQALAAGETRTLELPVWAGAASGDYHLRFGMSPHADSALSLGPAQRLHLADPPEPSTSIYIAGSRALGNGAALFDYDGDGDLDPYLIRRGAPDRLLRNDSGFFADVGAEAGIEVDGNSRGVAIGDADGDGDLDVYLVTELENRWFGNNGDGTFADLTADPLTDDSAGRSAAFLDADGDGDLDLYVVNADGANRCFVQDNTGFVDRAPELGLADDGSGRGVAVADIDEDGDPDLFLANRSGGSHLLRNDDGQFTEVESTSGVELTGGEVGAAFGDYNSDGRIDLFVAEERGVNRLFANRGDGTFTDAARRDSLDLGTGAVGAAFFDADNDGDLDLVTTAVNAKSGGDELFLSRSPFLLPFGSLVALEEGSSGRGLSVGDVDGDGAMDVLVADARRSRLYRNSLGRGNWLRVQLLGRGANRWGIGSRVEVWAGGRRTIRQLHAALGYASAKHPVLHFGLGAAPLADSVLVTWPDGVRSRHLNAEAGQKLLLSDAANTTTDAEAGSIPEALRLHPGFPNPFNASTTISYALPVAGRVRLALFGVNGQRIRLVADEYRKGGLHRATWDGTNDVGRQVASGVYFLLLESGGQRRTARLMLIR